MMRIHLKIKNRELRTILNDDIKIGLEVFYNNEEWKIVAMVGPISASNIPKDQNQVIVQNRKGVTTSLRIVELKKLCKLICTI